MVGTWELKGTRILIPGFGEVVRVPPNCNQLSDHWENQFFFTDDTPLGILALPAVQEVWLRKMTFLWAPLPPPS